MSTRENIRLIARTPYLRNRRFKHILAQEDGFYDIRAFD